MTTITEAKDKVAKKYGFSVWEFGENAMLTHISNEVLISDRFEQAAEIYAEAKAKEFAEWILVEGFEKYQDNGDCWWGKFNEEKDYSTEQLYENYNQNG